MHPSVMNVKQVAEYLGIHQQTLYGLVQTGKVPALKIGGQWRFSRTAVREWVRTGSFKMPKRTA